MYSAPETVASVNPLPKKRKLSEAVRRVVLFGRAREAVGGDALAAALGVSRRAVNYKIAVDRSEVTDADLRAAIAAIEARRVALAMLVDDIRGVLG